MIKRPVLFFSSASTKIIMDSSIALTSVNENEKFRITLSSNLQVKGDGAKPRDLFEVVDQEEKVSHMLS